MSYRGVKLLLLACSGVGALIAATADANAGALAIREQSTYGQGTSFAGIAAGGSLSSMFWNPATMTQMPGIQFEAGVSGILPNSSHTVNPISTLAVFGPPANNTGDSALVPNSYFSYQLNPNLWLGMSVNSPFGLSVSFPDLWAGRNYAANSSLKTYNATPSFAYRINDWISVGGGVQVQYGTASVTSGFLAAPGSEIFLNGTGWGYGFTAGVTVTPLPTTTIGLGWRSAINQKINGSLSSNPVVGLSTLGSVSTTVNLPDIVTLSLRHQVDPRWTLLGTVEWSNWSRIGTSIVTAASGAQATIGGVPVALPFQYQDGWFYSVGAEYKWDDRATLRAGVGWEKSPITDQVRTPRLPDDDRFWASVGASYKISRDLSFDLAYSHIWVKSAPINISATSGNPWFTGGVVYVGAVDSHIDILSISLKYRWDDAPAPRTALITK
jgi:long-chain fatty acid transport protein